MIRGQWVTEWELVKVWACAPAFATDFLCHLGQTTYQVIATFLIFCMCGMSVSSFLFMSNIFAMLFPQGED